MYKGHQESCQTCTSKEQCLWDYCTIYQCELHNLIAHPITSFMEEPLMRLSPAGRQISPSTQIIIGTNPYGILIKRQSSQKNAANWGDGWVQPIELARLSVIMYFPSIPDQTFVQQFNLFPMMSYSNSPYGTNCMIMVFKLGAKTLQQKTPSLIHLRSYKTKTMIFIIPWNQRQKCLKPMHLLQRCLTI